jgi:flagellin
VITQGDDVTKYLGTYTAGQTNGKVTAAQLSSSYVAFQNYQFDKANVKLESNTSTNIVSNGSKDTYILNTETNEITKIDSGSKLNDYLDYTIDSTNGTVTSASLKEQYRVLGKTSVSNGGTAVTVDATAPGTTIGATISDDFTTAIAAKQLYDADGNEVSGVGLNNYYDENGTYLEGLFSDKQATQEVSSTDISQYVNKTSTDVAGDLSFTLHVGADSSDTNKITTNIKSMSAASLGVDKLKSTGAGIVDDSGANATDAIDIIADALQKVSTQRSALGAVQNRLEHTIKNLDNIVENTTSAESQIRDTDMATEMVKYSNANILSQAGQAMLAQANQSNQGVLSLLG